MTEPEFVHYGVDGGIAVITLDRPSAANAQSTGVLAELDAAWTRADRDKGVRVVVFESVGKHFSAGHDMAEPGEGVIWDSTKIDEYYDFETRGYLHYALSWRNIPKPSIAAVQGKCIGAGLMLCWPCDLIVASDDALFSDPVLHMGITGVEMHAHTFELGARKAKEILFTGRAVTAEEARQCGMVNKVVSRADLKSTTLALAAQIAEMDPFALRLAKRAVNQTLDNMGYTSSVAAAFDLHHLADARAVVETGGVTNVLVDLDEMKAANEESALSPD